MDTRLPHIQYSLNGAEIILNSSGSHHELRKLDTRINLITNAFQVWWCLHVLESEGLRW